MSNYDIGALLAGFLINAFVGLMSYWKSAKNAVKIDTLTQQTNGIASALAERNAALLKVTSEAQLAKGVLQGTKEAKAKEEAP
jgi:hypothetical protein